MTYKSIHAILNDIAGNPDVLAAAAELGRRFEAHVTGIYVVPGPQIYPAIAGSDMFATTFDAYQGYFSNNAPKVRDAFEQAMRGLGVAHDFERRDSRRWLVSEGVAELCRAADLVVARNLDPVKSRGMELDFVERMVTQIAHPMLILPNGGRGTLAFREAIVGWNGKPQAIRAAFGALPLLKACESVRIVTVDPGETLLNRGEIPGADLTLALARHGVKAVAETLEGRGRDPGDVLLDHARSRESSFVVAGAYGRSRMREFILGGSTFWLLAHMDLPVLMSH